MVWVYAGLNEVGLDRIIFKEMVLKTILETEI